MEEILFTGIKVNELLERIGQLIESKIIDLQSVKQSTSQSEYISRQEVADFLKISLPTLHEWSKLKWLQSYKIGTRVLYKKSEVENALRKVSENKFKKGGFHGTQR